MSARKWLPGGTLAGFALAVLACGKSGSNQVTGVNNVPPVISSILVLPQGNEAMVAWGGQARVTVAAVDPDGDTSRLTYTWKTASGSAIGPNTAEAMYIHNRVVRENDT